MIAKIIEFSVRNRFLVLLLTGILVALGTWATYRIRLDAIPDLSDVQVIVEIPAGSFTKYEFDAETGLIFVDRFQSMPVVYTTNYESVPSTVGPDGDPLDALVITRQPVYPGALIRVPGIILAVPGSVGFRSLFLAFDGDVARGLDTATTLALLLVSLVAGLLFANLIVAPRKTLS